MADIIYVPTTTRFFYLSVVLGTWSWRIVGWSMTTHLKINLVLDALDMAVHQRRPEEVIHHSDQGTQYTSLRFDQRCREADVRPSLGSVGDAYDNALCESFFAPLECELIDRITLRTLAHGRREIFGSIKGGGTTLTVDTPRSATSPPSTTKGAAGQQPEVQVVQCPPGRSNSRSCLRHSKLAA